MLKNIKKFLKHSAVYSLSSIGAKAMGVILLPLYTSYLGLQSFGELAIIEVSIAIGVEILLLGQGQAMLMFNDSFDYKDRRESIFFTLSFYLCTITILILTVIFLIQSEFSSIFNIEATSLFYFKIGAVIVFLRVLNAFFLGKIQADQEPLKFTITNLTKIFLSLMFIVLFVAIFKLKIAGILYAYIIGESLIFIYLTISMIKRMKFRIEKDIPKIALSFGFPLVFSSIGFMILGVSDRYIIKYLVGNQAVGIYDLGYRVAGSLNMFLIMPFIASLMPSAYKIYGKAGDKRYYTKLTTYLTFILIWGGLALSLFSKELIKIFALNVEYWPSYNVVPVIVLSYVLNGLLLMGLLGQYLTRNTKNIAVITLLAASLNIILNFLFIPQYGYIAAAYTTLVSYFLLFIFSYLISNRYFYIPFEIYKLIKIFITGILLFFGVIFLNGSDILFNILYKLIAVSVFPIILFTWKFYEDSELKTISGFVRKWRNFKKWKEYIKGDS